MIFRDGNFWRRTDASDSARIPALGVGIAQDTVSSGGTLDVWTKGIITNSAWSLASGLRVFVGSGLGNIVTSSPPISGNYIVLIGRALTPTILELNPQQVLRLGD